MAEWSKALAQGASPHGRGFEPHSCHIHGPCLLPDHAALHSAPCFTASPVAMGQEFAKALPTSPLPASPWLRRWLLTTPATARPEEAACSRLTHELPADSQAIGSTAGVSPHVGRCHATEHMAVPALSRTAGSHGGRLIVVGRGWHLITHLWSSGYDVSLTR